MNRKIAGNLQYAALPYRRTADGGIEILLITSLRSRRWIIPKGWPAAGLTPAESAAREAMEEGGIMGRISRRPIGVYSYEKRTSRGAALRCTVQTFALEVETQLPEWPEQDRRSTRWFALQEAAKAVQEPELQALIANLPTLLKR
ncbi:MAG TPA: NUDIX hydrolase [Xanthobacteraceae bacterium]|nr:NUDIX hydrolase [Xanthobacteraceae bacterium]